MSEEFNPNREWSFKTNLSDISAPTQLGAPDVPDGYYQGDISDMYVQQNNDNRIVIKIKMLDAPFAGVVRTDGMNMPKSAEDNVRYYWRALAESAGYSPTQLDKGEINLGPKAFIGKRVFFHFKPKNGEGTYERISYFAESVWTQQRANHVANGGGTTASTGSALGGGGGGGGETTTPEQVLSSLGVDL